MKIEHIFTIFLWLAFGLIAIEVTQSNATWGQEWFILALLFGLFYFYTKYVLKNLNMEHLIDDGACHDCKEHKKNP